MSVESNEFARPEFLVSTEALASMLGQPDVRVFDCTTHLRPHPTKPYEVVSGREDYLAAHIPGAAFIDLQGDLSNNDSPLRFTYPGHDAVAEAAGRLGIGDGLKIVLYSQTAPQWAARIWWMLRAVGFDNAAVLDGGLAKWMAEGRRVDSGEATYPVATLTPSPRSGLIVQKDEVLGGLGQSEVCTINALSAEQHAGGGRIYGRAGHIAGSVNVPSAGLLDPDTQAFLPAEEIAKHFDAVGADKGKRIVTYCGGGIAASTTALLLTMLGHDNIGLYDNSLSEWAPEESLPMATSGS